MVAVWFIRHGESEANAGLPTVHPVTTSITEKGIKQAKQIALAIPQPPCLIVTSPYIRTKQTAQPTIDRFPDVPHIEWQVQEFTFLTPAHYHNTTIHQRRPRVDAYWEKCDPLFVDGEGAESFSIMIDRVQQMRSKIEQLNEKFVVVFSHGRFMRAILWVFLTNKTEPTPSTMRRFWAFSESISVPNGSILKTQFEAGEVWLNPITTAHLMV